MSYEDIARALMTLNVVIAIATVAVQLHLGNKRRWPERSSGESVDQYIERLKPHLDLDRVYARKIKIASFVGGLLMAATGLAGIIVVDRMAVVSSDSPTWLFAANLIYFVVGLAMVVMAAARTLVDRRTNLDKRTSDQLSKKTL